MPPLFDLEAVRAQLAVTRRTAYLNTGTAGPWPTAVVEAIEAALRREHELGRASPRGLPDFPDVLRQTRERLASWVGADPDEIALTHSATEGIDIVVWGLDWQPGDEVVTTSIEHRGVLVPLRQLAQRRGVVVRTADVGAGDPDQALSAISDAITDKTRLVALSHVSFSTGACFPIKRIAALAHAAGAQMLVDGAQAVGAIPVDARALDVEYYAFPGQKWLCGPEGTGGLYVRRESQAVLQPTFVSIRTDHAVAAARYEYTTVFRPGIHGLHTGLGWLDSLGREAIFRRTSELAAYCYERVAALPGVAPLTPRNAIAGLINVCFPEHVDLDQIVPFLQNAAVTVRSVPDTRSLRVSCAFFNTFEEIDALVRGLATR